MYKAELINSVAARAEIDQKTAAKVCNALFDVIMEEVEKGEAVNIVGFGKFSLHERGERMGRNPKTGEEIKIAARKVPFFKPSVTWKRDVN